MPNYVYCTIVADKPISSEVKEQLLEKGICETILPMPQELDITSSSTLDDIRLDIINLNDLSKYREEDIAEARQSFVNEELYNAKDWYSWKLKNYGTKWGDCDLTINDNVILFSTAWSPIDESIIVKLEELIGSFSYDFEEEQGWGAEFRVEDGEMIELDSWDGPDMEEVESPSEDYDYLYYLKTPHRGYEVGYYTDWSLEDSEYLGKNFKACTK